MASRPPWILGCSVFTRPSIISGKPVTSETSSTATPASASRCRALHGVRGKGPLHARRVAGTAVDDELHRAARSVRAGEVDALLDVDAVLVGAERPHLLVRHR